MTQVKGSAQIVYVETDYRIHITLNGVLHVIPAKWQGVPGRSMVLTYGSDLKYATSGAPPLADVEHCLTRAALNELNRLLEIQGKGMEGLAKKPLRFGENGSSASSFNSLEISILKD